MNKKEKEAAAIYLSACFDEMRLADLHGDPAAKARAEADYHSYNKKLKDLLTMKWEILGLGEDYEKSVLRPIQDVHKITLVFYSQRVNGQQLKYPA